MVWFQNFGSDIFFKPYPTQNLFQWNFAFPCPPILKKWCLKTVFLDFLGLPYLSIWVRALLIKQLNSKANLFEFSPLSEFEEIRHSKKIYLVELYFLCMILFN